MGRLLLVAIAALVLAGAAAAGTADRNRIALTAADTAAARRAVIRLADLGGVWTGGAVKPNLNDNLVCANYEPKQSDLVVTGAAEATFKVPTGAQIDSVAQVYRTAAMVQTDWKRSVLNPALASCLRSTLSGGLAPGEKIASVARVPFPQSHGVLAREYRFVLNISANGATTKGLLDLIVFSRGRTELSLSTIGGYSQLASISRVERVLVGVMLTRVTA